MRVEDPRRRRRRRHRAAPARRPPGLRRRARRPRRRPGRSARLPRPGCATSIGDRWLVVEKILAADETLPRTGRSTARPGTSTPPSSSTRCSTASGWGAPARPVDGGRRRRPAVPGVGARRPPARCSTAGCARISSGSPGSPRRRGGTPTVEPASTELSVHLERYRTYLPDEEGRPALDAAPRRGGRRPGPTWRGASTRSAGRRSDEPRRVADPLAAAHRSGDGQGRRGPGVLAVHAAGVAGRGRRPAGARPAWTPHADAARPPPRTAGPLAARRCWPARPTTPSGPRTCGPSAWPSPPTPTAWLELFDEWLDGPGAPITTSTPATHWLALQTVVTTPDIDADRLQAFLVKAAREADLRTSWAEPDGRLRGARWPCSPPRVVGWAPCRDWPPRCAGPAGPSSLALLAVRLTAPGVPDLYQGTEGFRYVLVDPDNRAEPDHAELDALVARAASLDGRGGVGRGRRPGGAGRRDRPGARRPPTLDPRRRTSRSTPATTLAAFARTDWPASDAGPRHDRGAAGRTDRRRRRRRARSVAPRAPRRRGRTAEAALDVGAALAAFPPSSSPPPRHPSASCIERFVRGGPA